MWTPRCSLVGVTLDWVEMDTTLLAICNSQVSPQNLYSGIGHICEITMNKIYFGCVFCENVINFFLLFFPQFLLIIQPLEHVALIHHCHASRYVKQLLESV